MLNSRKSGKYREGPFCVPNIPGRTIGTGNALLVYQEGQDIWFGAREGKISYAWSRLYKMLSATYCVYAHRGWIGLKDSRPKVQDFHVNVPSWSFQQTLD